MTARQRATCVNGQMKSWNGKSIPGRGKRQCKRPQLSARGEMNSNPAYAIFFILTTTKGVKCYYQHIFEMRNQEGYTCILGVYLCALGCSPVSWITPDSPFNLVRRVTGEVPACSEASSGDKGCCPHHMAGSQSTVGRPGPPSYAAYLYILVLCALCT